VIGGPHINGGAGRAAAGMMLSPVLTALSLIARLGPELPAPKVVDTAPALLMSVGEPEQ
jgi:hypothetical protein